MSKFLQRNKKKGLLASLLLFLKRGKGVGPLLLIVGMLAFVFIAPTGLVSGSPFLQRLAAKLGFRSNLPAGSSLTLEEQLAEALHAARERARLRGGMARGGRGVDGYYGRSTVDLVKGGKGLNPGEDEAAVYDAVGKGAGKSVDGILRPEDAAKADQGVALSEEELREGLLRGGGIQEIGAGAGNPGGLKDLLGLSGGNGIGAASAGGGMSGARATDGRVDLLGEALKDERVPRESRAIKLASTRGGNLSMRGFRKINARMSKALDAPKGDVGNKRAMYQLAEGRAYSIAAAPPPGHCDPGACPAEFASTASGATFDGTRVTAPVLDTPEFGGGGLPDVPSQGQIDGLIDEAQQMEEDARKCEEAEEKYGPDERKYLAEVQHHSDRLANANCGGGGCSSKSHLRRCQAIGDDMRVSCRKYNQVARQKAAACPLMNGEFSEMDCEQ